MRRNMGQPPTRRRKKMRNGSQAAGLRRSERRPQRNKAEQNFVHVFSSALKTFPRSLTSFTSSEVSPVTRFNKKSRAGSGWISPTRKRDSYVSHVAFYRSEKGECQQQVLLGRGWVTYAYPLSAKHLRILGQMIQLTSCSSCIPPSFLFLFLPLWLFLWDFFCSRKGSVLL